MRATLVVLLACGAASGFTSRVEPRAPEEEGDLPGGTPPDRRMVIEVPARADEALVVATPDADVSVSIQVEGAEGVAAIREASQTHRYPSALGPGIDLVRAEGPGGVEDWVVFPEDPGHRAVHLAVAPRAAGLRLVEDTLELLDATGTPRLRMAPPWVADASGARHAVQVALTDCDADRDPRAPWGRPVTPPGASWCDVELLLPEELTFPAVLDPLWTDTRGLVVPRALHGAIRLDDGRVLIAGGASVDVDQASAELFDPTSDTIAMTGRMARARRAHTLTRLVDGRALAVGGDVGFDLEQLTEVERYDPTSGTWTTLRPLALGRSHHAVATLAGGDVLITGAYDYQAQQASRSVERCGPDGDGCTAVAPMLERRGGHSATSLPDGRLLVIGGAERQFTDGSTFHRSTEIYDPGSDTWSPGPELPEGRVEHAVAAGRDGRLLVLGGTVLPQGTSMTDAVVAIDPGTLRLETSGELDVPRWLHATAELPNGRVLLVGRGSPNYGIPLVTAAEAFDPMLGASVSAGSLSPRAFPTATALRDGRVLVVGGRGSGSPPELADASLFGDRLGAACDELEPTSCPNGVCLQAICSAPDEDGSGGGGGSLASTTSSTSSSGGGSSSEGGGGSAGGAGEGAGGDGGAPSSSSTAGSASATATTGPGSNAPSSAAGSGGASPIGPVGATSGDAEAPTDRADGASFYACGITQGTGRGGHPPGWLLMLMAGGAAWRRRPVDLTERRRPSRPHARRRARR